MYHDIVYPICLVEMHMQERRVHGNGRVRVTGFIEVATWLGLNGKITVDVS